MAEVQLKNIKPWHEHIIDLMIANPMWGVTDIAKEIGYSITWVSIMLNSDAFKERLTERKAEIVNPLLTATVKDRLTAVGNKALDRMLDRLETRHLAIKDKDLIEMAKLGSMGADAIGPGALPAGNMTQNNLYMVSAPPAATNAAAWVAGAQGKKQPLPLAEVLPGDRNV